MGKHSGTRRRRRGIVAGALVAVIVVGTGIFWVTRDLGPLVRPDDPCAEAPPLRTFQGVKLQPAALKAYRKADRLAGGAISVVQSYRSCDQQAEACRSICGNPNGCPGRCASPGTSYHQLGAAIDVTQETLDTSGAISALVAAGWCQSEPRSDPGHFSFDGCH